MNAKLPIYLDNNATTRTDPRVVEAMLPYFTDIFGNAASRNHEYGWGAEEAVDKARGQIAKLVGANVKEIIFTSGATESNNLALKGALNMYAEKGNHLITVTSEHNAILDTCKALEREGKVVTYLPIDEKGFINLDDLRNAITDKTVIVSVMYANNEMGVIQDVKAIGAICREKGVFFHTDATQAVGKVPINVEEDNIDIMSFSAHKMYGPKGVGALYVRRRNPRVLLQPMMDGGGHERGMRSGTLNVPGIVGFGKAAEICKQELADEAIRAKRLANKLKDGLMSALEETYLNGDWEKRLPGNVNISFNWVEGESLLMGLKEIALSSGSACTSATLEPSHVLKALGLGDDLAHSSLRFGIGRFNTEEDIDYTISRVTEVVTHLREMSPLMELAKEGVDLKTFAWQP